ncbi:hypothetical protein DDB_G0267572 [Dictyostelium discoideum AX4]|uniref:Ribosome biogenesis protein NOP53 n=1 Tax=Dictyostelium discoideum TaxID=44689 RepID=Q55GP6_DICDI|nr:hypothetical protein DDB_G0267572 [Dictyostelium discoideum AX4]EAL73239.1 hypothetical protein DDB_G0267572 [Dictyostelium discoideum AX4]|eukprot:XP_647138.1 hypothetical protein DDB_G0267572 [Dictyostelium discoideum AX4]
MVHKKNQKQRARVEQTTIAMEVMEKEVQHRIKYGAPVSEKKDNQLFFVDKKGGSTTSSSNKSVEYLTKSEKILQANPNIDSMSTGTKHEKVEKKLLAPVEMKFQKHLTNLKKQKSLLPAKTTLRKQKSKLKNQSIDLWGSTSTTNNNSNENNNENIEKKIKINKNFKKITTIIDKNNDFVTNNLLENRVIKHTKMVNHPSVIKKVDSLEIAEPGMSYNPSYQDHQDTLGVALAKEIIALEYVENVDKVLNPEYIEYEKDDTIEDDDNNTDNIDNNNVGKPGERITKLEKNKRIRRAEEMKRQKLALQKKEFNKQVDEVLDTLQEVVEAEQVAKELNKKRVEKKSLNNMPRRLGKYKLSDSSEPILLTHELPKSLSTLRNNNYNPLKDRYQSLQKRHIIEASGPQQKPKKATKKVYTSNSWNNTTVASLD